MRHTKSGIGWHSVDLVWSTPKKQFSSIDMWALIKKIYEQTSIRNKQKTGIRF